jgi:hypothetical protein
VCSFVLCCSNQAGPHGALESPGMPARFAVRSATSSISFPSPPPANGTAVIFIAQAIGPGCDPAGPAMHEALKLCRRAEIPVAHAGNPQRHCCSVWIVFCPLSSEIVDGLSSGCIQQFRTQAHRFTLQHIHGGGLTGILHTGLRLSSAGFNSD